QRAKSFLRSPLVPGRCLFLSGILAVNLCLIVSAKESRDARAVAAFRQDIQPILSEYCRDCHGDGANKGKVTLDEFKTDKALLDNQDLWWRVLKNVRAGIMPPEKKPRPSADEVRKLETWIKREAFGIDPQDPDPGRVTLRRLNRVEYRNTVR